MFLTCKNEIQNICKLWSILLTSLSGQEYEWAGEKEKQRSLCNALYKGSLENYWVADISQDRETVLWKPGKEISARSVIRMIND